MLSFLLNCSLNKLFGCRMVIGMNLGTVTYASQKVSNWLKFGYFRSTYLITVNQYSHYFNPIQKKTKKKDSLNKFRQITPIWTSLDQFRSYLHISLDKFRQVHKSRVYNFLVRSIHYSGYSEYIYIIRRNCFLSNFQKFKTLNSFPIEISICKEMGKLFKGGS